jgi:hypothetical protein
MNVPYHRLHSSLKESLMGPFEALIYTDCRPGEGLQASAGLQVQAASDGADAGARAVVQRSLLYEASDAWMRARRPVGDYPRSFAHVWDDVIATATGTYLGREANGNREGNHLTHAILTRDPDTYAGHRPAQLYWAPFWARDKAPSSHCPPIHCDGDLPFGPAEAQQFVLGEPGGRALLTALLSAAQRLAGRNPRRIAFIGTDPEPILRWIATATLLLPRLDALRISVKVFSTNPAYASHQIVGVCPEFGPVPFSVEDDRGLAVFDLGTGRFSDIGPTASAAGWVDLFCDDDPADVMDMIEIAGGSLLPQATAPVIGRIAKRPRDVTPAEAATIVEWLRDTPPSLLPRDRPVLTRVVVDRIDRWPLPILLDLDTVARSGQLDPEGAALTRLAVMQAETDEARAGRPVSAAPLGPLPDGAWPADRQRLAEAQATDALHASASPAVFAAILRLASRYGLDIHPSEAGHATVAFIADWSHHPEWSQDRSAWPVSATAVLGAALEEELLARADDPAQHERIGDLWWPDRIGRLERIETAFDAAIAAAAMARMPAADRSGLVRRLIAAGTGSPRAAVAALWARTAPSHDELRLVAEFVPAATPIRPDVFAPVVRHLLDADELSNTTVDLARRLAGKRLLRDTAALDLLARDTDLARICTGATARPGDAEVVADVRRLAAFDPRLLRLRQDLLVDAVRTLTDPADVVRILESVPAAVPAYANGLVTTVRTARNTGVDDALIAYALSGSTIVPPPWRAALHAAALRWNRRSGSAAREYLVIAVTQRCGPAAATRWVDASTGSRLVPFRRRGAGT